MVTGTMTFDANAVQEFHAHVYYDMATRGSASAMRDRMVGMAGSRLKVYTLSDGPRGPHVMPMFGVDIPRSDLPEVLSYLMMHHGPHAVLIHPVTDDELKDHTHHALWLGERQPLNLSVLGSGIA